MRKPEAKYRYALNKDKYDPEVKEAVGKKKLSEKDAITINKIQEMMRKEREERGSRNIVTSENRAEFMAKKLKLANEEEPIYEEEAEEDEETKHPIAPVPDKKYIKGTPEHKKAKAKQKPINGMPTNRR